MTFPDPERIEESERIPYRPKRYKSRPKKNKHKHVWVEVSFREYANAVGYWYFEDEPDRMKGNVYFLCAGCDKRKINRLASLARERAIAHREGRSSPWRTRWRWATGSKRKHKN